MLNAFWGYGQCLHGWLLPCTGSAMIIILDHSLLHLNTGLERNQTEYLIDSGAIHNFISSQLCSAQGIEVITDSSFDIHVGNQQTVPVVGTCQILAALGPFKTVLRLYVINADVPIILGIPFLVTVNPKIDC